MPKLTFRQTAIATGLTAIAVGGFVLGWLQNDDGGRPLPKAGAVSEWMPLKPKTADLPADAKILATKLPFGAAAQQSGAAPGGNVPTAAAQWRIGGVVTTESRRHLVLLIRQPGQNSDRPEDRQVGDQLPDGSIIRAVEPGSVTVDRGDSIVTIKMFAQK
jgi:hypothetical protein